MFGLLPSWHVMVLCTECNSHTQINHTQLYWRFFEIKFLCSFCLIGLHVLANLPRPIKL